MESFMSHRIILDRSLGRRIVSRRKFLGELPTFSRSGSLFPHLLETMGGECNDECRQLSDVIPVNLLVETVGLDSDLK